MRRGFKGWTRTRPLRQGRLPFMARARRRERAFKGAILALTSAVVVASIGGTRAGRFAVASFASRARFSARRLVLGEAGRDAAEALNQALRARAEDLTRQALADFYRDARPEMRRLFDATGMDPAHGLIASGRPGEAFVLSPQVFQADDRGRSYRLRPGVRSVWLRQITLTGGPHGHFLVADTPQVRAAATAVGAVVEESSRQTTNSWGLRGPEPAPSAPFRVLVLGDSYMQGMFVGDDDAPPVRLERALTSLRNQRVSVLNTGHLGYCPEQYFRCLEEYGDRFRPHVLVVSVCPNDFGDGNRVLAGEGDAWDEAAHWLEEVVLWCRGRGVMSVLVPAPVEREVVAVREDGRYPGPVSDLYRGPSLSYCDPLEAFVDASLVRLVEERRRGSSTMGSPLFNGHIGDGHFSPAGSELWARIVARRVNLLMSLKKVDADRE
ncbi:MAG: SGNH/GDSL hydrolase family protein [Isosphaeraceae bacterium]